jgi:hypothetical protein
VNVIPQVNNTNIIRYADLFRLTMPDGTYYFATTPTSITVPAISSTPFTGLGQLVSVNNVQRDIKSTPNETTVTLVGIDTTMLGIVLNAKIKGSQIELWHAFFDSDNVNTGVYKYFNGYVNSFSISEQWMEEARAYVGVVTISAASFQLVLQNRNAGRYTNDNAWQSFAPGDTSMNRVTFVSTINYAFGKTNDS